MTRLKILVLFVFAPIVGEYLSETEFNGLLRSIFDNYDKSIRAG